MYRAPALPSAELELAIVDELSRWSARRRALTLVLCLLAGVTMGLVALDRLQEWAHVFALAYGTMGLFAGWVTHRLVALPLLRRQLRRRVTAIAREEGLDPAALEPLPAAYLV